MKTTLAIMNAAQLIRDIDPALANVSNQPFNRDAAIAAFDKSLRISCYSDIADRIINYITAAANKDRRTRILRANAEERKNDSIESLDQINAELTRLSSLKVVGDNAVALCFGAMMFKWGMSYDDVKEIFSKLGFKAPRFEI